MPRIRKSWQERLWEKIRLSPGCWEWQGAKIRGYGVLSIKKAARLAHRLAYESAHGPIPDGLLACHHCDNPACCRPDHLFLGTYADNHADMDAKGRRPKVNPDGHHFSILNSEQVRFIRRERKGARYADIAKEFGIGLRTVGELMRRESWKEVA